MKLNLKKRRVYEDVSKEFFDFLGEGCFKEVYGGNHNYVLKIPKNEGEYPWSCLAFSKESKECYSAEEIEILEAQREKYENCHNYLLEAPFPSWSLKVDRWNSGKFFITRQEEDTNTCEQPRVFSEFLNEVETYINADSESRKMLNRIVEVGVFENNCPYIIAEKVDGIFDQLDCRSSANREESVSDSICLGESGYSLEAFLELEDDPITVMAKELDYSDFEIQIVKEKMFNAIDKLGLYFSEQVDNWGNLGYCSESRKIVMVDYA